MVAVGDLIKVTRDDIQDFPGDTIKLVLEMQKDGWRAQRSNRNHIMLFGPDGETRLSASRNADSARYLAEDLRKYNKANGKEEKVVKVRTVAQKFPCIKEDCNRTFNSAENLTLHVGLDHDGLIKCPDCNEMFKKPTGLGRHRQVKHGHISERYIKRKEQEAKRQEQDQILKNDEKWNTGAINVDSVTSTFNGVYATGKLNAEVVRDDISLVRKAYGDFSGDIQGASIYAEPKSDEVEHIDFLDERDSWTMKLDAVSEQSVSELRRTLEAAGLSMEIRVWRS